MRLGSPPACGERLAVETSCRLSASMMTLAEVGEVLSETHEPSRPLETVAVGKGSAPQHVCSAAGPGRRQILGPARHPVHYIPNRLLRHALIEMARPVHPVNGHSLGQTWLIRIPERPVLAIPGPMPKNLEGGG